MLFSSERPSKQAWTVTTALSTMTRKRTVIRLGFAVVLGFLMFSTFEAFEIQKSLNEEALEIYRHHVKQDDAFYVLRRTIWLGSSNARDLLLNPFADREAVYRKQLKQYRESSLRALADLDEASRGMPTGLTLKAKVHDFWNLLDRMPNDTRYLNAEARYAWIQREIVSRRNAVGQVVREFQNVTKQTLSENETAFTTTRRQGAQRLVIILGVSLFLAIIVAAISLAHSENLERKTRQQYEEVAQAKLDLQSLAARLMEVQETERTRISREMHDEIGQALATLRIEIAHAETLSKERLPEIVVRLRRARELAERTVETVRNMCALLRPSLLDDLGLEAALEWHLEDFSWRTGVQTSLERSGKIDDVSDAAKTCVYRVVQESIHNCAKHACASKLLLRLRRIDGAIEVAVEDNGVGFRMKSHKDRVGAGQFGLLGMEERAASLGGTLEVTAEPGAGTKVVLTLPILPTQAAPSLTAVKVAG